jgi:hypothetical protein
MSAARARMRTTKPNATQDTMSLSVDVDASRLPRRTPLLTSELDFALTAQIVVAWAGEAGDEKRLGWWRTDLISEFGGEDLFQRLLPNTWQWATLQATREAARRRDAELRTQNHSGDPIVSLFHLGFELDERLDERLRDLKRSGVEPHRALPGLQPTLHPWRRDAFRDWADGQARVETTAEPLGRRIAGAPPATLDGRVRKLVAGLLPLGDTYPLPHFRLAP